MESLIFRHGVFRVELVSNDELDGDFLSITRDGEDWEMRFIERKFEAIPDIVEVRNAKNYMLAIEEVDGPSGRNRRLR